VEVLFSKKSFLTDGADSEGYNSNSFEILSLLVPQIIEYILVNPGLFEGSHNHSQPRTSDGLTILDPMRYEILLYSRIIERQLKLVWEALCIHINDSMSEGRGIQIKNFGAFTFEPRISTNGNSKNRKLSAAHLRPCFVIAPSLESHLKSSSIKDEFDHHIEGSIYQQGVRMSYLNPVPIASGCYYSSDFVRCAVDTFFKAINDLVMRGFNVVVDFEKLASISLMNRTLKVTFNKSLHERVEPIEKSYPLKSINAPLSALSVVPTKNNISHVHAIVHAKPKGSRLSSLQRPDSSMLKDIKSRIDKLDESSRDLCNISIS
jgi:nucleoid DNA-binding protein